ncbi:MAG TPA: zf-HC2 domain-containing protein [Bacteroidota bacterium]|nr:zf-HC2 domain-containing protein [Bacteroidota bacterium]
MHTEERKYALPEYLQGKLDDVRREEVELHLKQCADCRQELEELRATFRELEHQRFYAPSAAYFASLAPRVRMRLEQRTPFGWHARILSGWLRDPVFMRIALPLATAGLAVALLVHLPSEQDIGIPMGVAATLSTDDVAEVLASEQALALSESPVEGSIPEEVINRQLAAQLITNGTVVGLSEWLDTPTDQLLTGWSEEDVASLLQRLEERVILQ